MTTISKFYLLDAATSNTGTMPGAGDALIVGATTATTGDATGARTARDATDTHGTSNPDIESSITSNADQVQQIWGHRRFVSRPLAAETINEAGSGWTFSYARSESNLNHNQSIRCAVYAWRPSSGVRVGAGQVNFTGTEPAAASTETVESIVATGTFIVTLVAGDILVFDITTVFSQAMATAYTEQFAYNGTTEASTTTCASFISCTNARTLYVAAGATSLVTSRRIHNLARR